MNKKKKQWIMPLWMEKYRPDITNTGGNDIEELMNDTAITASNNWIRLALIVAVIAQIGLLENLHKKKLIL